jgi:hypothetical protein
VNIRAQPQLEEGKASRLTTMLAQSFLADYMACLRDYRAMQQRLGPRAAAAARRLVSATSHLTQTWPWEQQQRDLRDAALSASVTERELRSLVAARRRLLHDLPALRSRVRAASAGAHTKDWLCITQTVLLRFVRGHGEGDLRACFSRRV